MQLPPTVALVESGVEYVADAHDIGTPAFVFEKEDPLTEEATGWLYQPFESAERDSPTEMVGDEASYWNEALVPLTVLPA